MLSWVMSLFTGRGRYDLYKPSQRLIYRFWNGQKVVKVDPLVTYKRMMECGPELSIDIRVANSPSKDATKAHTSLIKHIQTIFDLKPLAEGGLTDLEAAEVLDHFLRYCEHCKKKSRNLVTSPMETSAVSAPISAAGPPTTNTSASGSTGNAPSTAEPTPSPSEPASPSVP